MYQLPSNQVPVGKITTKKYFGVNIMHTYLLEKNITNQYFKTKRAKLTNIAFKYTEM